MRIKLCVESWVLLVIGAADLISTILFIEKHGASEANPLFKAYWEMGLGAFIVAKCICVVGPVIVMEWARKRNPKFVTMAMRTSIVGYALFYGVGVVHLNNHGDKAAGDEMISAARRSDIMARISFNRHSMLEGLDGTSLNWKALAGSLAAYHNGMLTSVKTQFPKTDF